MNLYEKLIRAISGLEERNKVAAHLVRLLKTQPSERPVAIWHPVGFVDIPLMHDKASALRQRDRATIHVWHPELSHPQIPPHICHSHGWRLRSRVLHGEFVNETYNVTLDSRGEYVLYEVAYGDGVSRSISTNQLVNVSISSTESLGRGAAYEISSSTYHWTRQINNDLIVTAMAGTELSGQPPRNVRLMPCDPEYIYRRSECPEDVRQRIFDDVIDRLQTNE